MRKPNAQSDFISERNEFLLTSFRSQLARQSQLSLENAFHGAAHAPAPRFWVSESRAAHVLGKMLSGADPTADMLPEKREMYRELFARFLALRQLNPEASIAELAFSVVNTAAPRSYMSPMRARQLIYLEKRRIRMQRRKEA